MYCVKCGNELREKEQFCSNCGTKVGYVPNRMNLNFSTDDIKNKFTEMKSNFVSSVADTGKNKVLLLANIALLLISFIFSLTETFKVDAILGINESMSMFDDMQGVKAFFIFGYLLSISSIFIPLLFKKSWKPKFFLPAKVVTIASTGWFFLLLITGLEEVKSSEFSSMAEFAPTPAGWIFLIATLCAIILSFKLALDFKKQNTLVVNEEQNIN